MSNLESVNMLGIAREAQDVDKQRFRPGSSFRVLAPAKVNLFLNIGERLPDGYHAATSVMHSLLLHDVLYMKRQPYENLPFYEKDKLEEGSDEVARIELPGGDIVVRLTMRAFGGVELPSVAAADNLVVKALRLLGEKTERQGDEFVDIHLEKYIPAQAGLGGGSSDAAAILAGAAQWWGVDFFDKRVQQTARKLGADVMFFLHGGCSRLEGRGDEFAQALEPMKSPVVLVKPAEGVSTVAAYGAFDAAPVMLPPALQKHAEEATAAKEVPFANNLQEASFSLLPELETVQSWLAERCGASRVLMSGSGSAFFALCDSLAQASQIAGEARVNGWWARSTSFSSLGASLAPLR